MDEIDTPPLTLAQALAAGGVTLPLRLGHEEIGDVIDDTGRLVLTTDVGHRRTDREVISTAALVVAAVNACGGHPAERAQPPAAVPDGYGMRELEDVRVACLARVDAAAQRAEFTPEQHAFALRLVAEISGGIEELSLPVGQHPNGAPHPAPAQEPVAVPAKELYPAHPGALRACMAELDMWLDSSDALDEIKNQQSFGESIMLVVHELKRLQSVLAAAPVSPPADHSEDTLDMVKAPPAESGEVERLRSQDEEIEELAQWLHDEGGFGDAWACHTWPEHPDDDGRREGGYLKIVPSDVQAKFRDVARRLLRGRTFAAAPSPQPGGAVKVKALEWEKYWAGGDDQGSKSWMAWRPTNAITGSAALTIYMDGDSWTEGTCESGKFPDLDTAKQARQADYERRILSALEPSPSDWNAGAFEAGAKAMRKAIVAKTEDFGYLAVEEIMTLPLPTPPAGEG